MLHVVPDCVLTERGFVSGVGLTLDGDGTLVALDRGPAPGARVLTLPGIALMGGFVNAHSHAFQRLLRGRIESPVAAGSGTNRDFWTWRKEMYRLMQRLGPDELETVARFAYGEMARAGYTVVREFHYLHHPPGGGTYADVHEMSLRLVAAAADAGLGLELLRVAYLNVSEPEQRRFADADVDAAIARTEDLSSRVPVPVGVAPHSVRAVTPAGIAACASWARQRGASCDVHVAEQPAEVAFTLTSWGRRPVELLDAHGVLGPGTTLIHATHVSDDEVQLLGTANATVCLCPTTEANLGDGVSKTSEFLAATIPLAIGSDSQAEIDPFAELRMLEYNERNRHGRRQVLDPVTLLMAVTEPLLPGTRPHCIAIDRSHPSIEGVEPPDLGAALVMAGRADCVAGVFDGDQIVRPHVDPEPYRRLVRRLLA